MSELKTLYRHASHYLGGRICLMLLGFVSFPILARVFSVADYGIMSLVLKLVLLMTVLGKFGLQNSVQRFYPEEGKSLNSAVRRKYYSSLITGSAVVGTLAMAAYAAGLWLAPERLLEPRLRYLLLFTSGLILIRSLQPTLIGFLRAEGRTKTYNSIEIGTRAATVLTACTLLIVWKRELTVFLGTTIAVEAAAVLALLWFLYKQGVFAVSSFNRQYFQKAALFAFPLIGYELASVILDSGDRLFVQRYMGAQALGYYSAAYNIATYVEESLMVPINLALFPIYMRIWIEKGKEETQAFLSRSLNNFVTLAIGIVCVVLLTSKDLIVVLASSKFQEAHRLLPVLVVGLLVYAIHIFLNAALLIHKKTRTMAALVVYSCVANIVLNVVLIPKIGLQGAAMATLLSYMFLLWLMARVSFRLLPLNINYYGFLANLAAAALTFAAVRNVQFSKALLSGAVKGVLGFLLYSIFVVLLNPALRRSLSGRLRGLFKEAKPPQPVTAPSV